MSKKNASKQASALALAVWEELEGLYKANGDKPYFQEPVSHIQHAELSAHNAVLAKASLECVIGALLHDVGHIFVYSEKFQKPEGQEGKDTLRMIYAPDQAEGSSEQPGGDDLQEGMDVGVVDHENLGAAYLWTLGLPPISLAMVAFHVSSKRYLVYKDPKYRNDLASDSKISLIFQGGAMTSDEADAFEKCYKSKEGERDEQKGEDSEGDVVRMVDVVAKQSKVVNVDDYRKWAKSTPWKDEGITLEMLLRMREWDDCGKSPIVSDVNSQMEGSVLRKDIPEFGEYKSMFLECMEAHLMQNKPHWDSRPTEK